jgi:hypothetical protein
MNHDEAKFILGVYRPDGRDAGDPAFTAALAQAKQDPALGAWLKREMALDEALSAKLGEMPVPEMREQLRAGVRASRRRQVWWRGTAWLAAAAALVVLIGVVGRLRVTSRGAGAVDLAAFARQDLAVDGKDHLGAVPGLASLQQHLADPATRLSAGIATDLTILRQQGCRVVKVSGHDVYELCFARDGEFHLYVAARSDFESARVGREPELVIQNGLASASWSDDRYVYVAVTDRGLSALRRIL